MRRSPHPRRHALRPACDTLEVRSLLSAGGTAAVHAAPTALRSENDFSGPIVPRLPVTPDASFSTVPANGDVNPYGVAFVPAGFRTGGMLHPGDVLVSNFNARSNLQGTGTTIVDISPTGHQSLFYTSPHAGLSTGLGVLKAGFVIVGNVPTDDGSFNTIGQGVLQVINRFGHVVLTIANTRLLDGPWDLTIREKGDDAQVFVSNALTGTVSRVDLDINTHIDTVTLDGITQIGSGYVHRGDPAALVIAPTGLAYDPVKDLLYVASTGDNAIYAISNPVHRTSDAGKGTLVYRDNAHLRGPLGLALAPNGDLLTTNGDAINGNPAHPSELIEFTPQGRFVGILSLDPAQGAAFGLAIKAEGDLLTLVTVNDDTNKLDVRTLIDND
jgi:DNA-binding beta-propeller fold protein YncE